MTQDKTALQELYVSWKEQSRYPCGNGVFGPVATEYGLMYTDATILGWVNFLAHRRKTISIMIDGKRYVWMCYKTILRRYRMLVASNTNNLSTAISSLVKRGLLEKHNEHDPKLGHRVFLHIPDDVQYFLFYRADIDDDIKMACREWIEYKATGAVQSKAAKPTPEGGGLFPEESKSKPLPDWFVSFIDHVKEVSHLKPKIQDGNGKTYKGITTVYNQYGALLDGSFVAKYKPENPSYDYTTIGPVAAEEIAEACKRIPAYVSSLPNFFRNFKSGKSPLLDIIAEIRTGKKVPYKPVAKIEKSDKDEMIADQIFQDALKMIKRMYQRFDFSEPVVAALWKLHNWYLEHRKDLIEQDKRYGTIIGRNAMLGLAEFLGRMAARKNRTPHPDDLVLGSSYWDEFALSVKKSIGVKIVFDEALYNRADQRGDQLERLFEQRPDDYA